MSSVKNHAKRSSVTYVRTYNIFGMFAERARIKKAQVDLRKMTHKEEK